MVNPAKAEPAAGPARSATHSMAGTMLTHTSGKGSPLVLFVPGAVAKDAMSIIASTATPGISTAAVCRKLRKFVVEPATRGAAGL